jgi:hypothetical protein
MSTNGTGSDEPIKSNVSLDALGNPGAPAPVNTPDGTGTPPATPEGASAGTPPAGTPPAATPPSGDGTPPANVEPTVLPTTFDGLLPLITATSGTQEVADLRNTLLTTFKGNNIDATGNILNDKGEVVLKAETLKVYLETEKLPTNAEGKYVNDKGEVVGEPEPQATLIDTVKGALATNFGLDLSTVEVEDTEEGLVALTQEAIKQKSNSAIYNFLEAHPDIKGLYQHIRLGGKVEDYNSSFIDYGTINVKTLDESAKIDLLNKMFTSQGVPNKDNLIKLINGAGEEEVNKAVSGALVYLDNKQKQETASRTAQLQAQAKQEAEETEKYWNTVHQVVKDGKVGAITIPVTDRDAFFEYMSKPVTEDLISANDLDAEKDSLEFQLAMSYLRFKKGDINKLVQTLSRQERVESLQDKLKRLQGRTDNGSAPRTGNQQQGNGDSISLTRLLGNKS